LLQYTYEVHVVARDRACLQKKDAGERTDMATVADCWAGAMKAAAGARRSARESFIVDLTCQPVAGVQLDCGGCDLRTRAAPSLLYK